jgi:hypothetical protein
LSVLWVAYATHSTLKTFSCFCGAVIPPHRHTKATVVTDQTWMIQSTHRHTVSGGFMCRIRRLLMMGTRVPETCRAE